MKKTARNIVVKMLLNPDEYLAFDGACAAEDVSHSSAARHLVKGWVAERLNGSQRVAQREWPGMGQNMAMLLPSRQQYGKPALHMRL